jgi:hypothetical protein
MPTWADTSSEVLTKEVELHNIDTEVEVYEGWRGFRGWGWCWEPSWRKRTYWLISKGSAIHAFYSDKKHAKMV